MNSIITTKKLTAIEQFQVNLLKITNSSTLLTTDSITGGTGVSVTDNIDYIYQFNKDDRTYDTSQYHQSGVFSATTSPWLNTLNSVPEDWQWSPVDLDGQKTRTKQVETENKYIQDNVTGQTYSGTAIEQLQQRFSKGMWDPSVFSQEQIDTLTENWINDDDEFARQRLGSANPNVMKKYNGDVSELQSLVDNSTGAANKDTLSDRLIQANNAGKLFVCDYNPTLGNIEKNGFVQTNAKPDYMPNGFFFSVPIAFFIMEDVDGKDVLKPVAIQIESTSNGYIFTTEDGTNAWLLAKLWVASADAQWWFSGTHLFNTHSIDMIFGIAALNQQQLGKLPEDHPMFILMRPHLKKVFNINNGVYNANDKDTLYQKGEFTDQFLPTGRIGIYQLINDLYQNYSFDDQAFDKTITARGITSNDFSGSFPYRDDGQVWWNAISHFVSSVVNGTYANDDEVAADDALNGWMKMVESAFNQDGTNRFTWTPTVSYLTQAFTNLFFLTTVQHTAVNDTMFPGWAFVPNGAFAMTGKPPTTGEVDDNVLLNSLPNPQSKSDVNGINMFAWPAQNQINFVMSGTADVTEVLADDQESMYEMYPYAQGSAQYQAVTNFYNALWQGTDSVKNQISKNQNTRIDAYQTANPETTTVPNSVSYKYLSVALPEGSTLNAPVMNCIQI